LLARPETKHNSLNLRRRHLTPSQTACVAVEALPFYEAEAKERMKIRKGNQPGATSSPKMDNLGRADFFVADDFKVARGYVAFLTLLVSHARAKTQ